MKDSNDDLSAGNRQYTDVALHRLTRKLNRALIKLLSCSKVEPDTRDDDT